MIYIIGGATMFLVMFSVTNFLLIREFRVSYTSHPRVFLMLFAGCTITAVWIFPDARLYERLAGDAILILIAAFSYAIFSFWWEETHGHRRAAYNLYLPHEHLVILEKSAMNGVVKVAEIVVQQSCAFVILTGLFELGLSKVGAAAFFAVTVSLLHLPGLRALGPLFGWFCLVTAAGFSFLYPWVVDVPHAFGWLVCLHALVYVAWWLAVPRLGLRTK